MDEKSLFQKPFKKSQAKPKNIYYQKYLKQEKFKQEIVKNYT
jgi:hypothetical protein